MRSFELNIVTPDGLMYSGPADMLHVRTIEGDIGVRARHVDFATALGMGELRLDIEEEHRYAACIGGLLTVRDGEVCIVATTFEWADEIDPLRVKMAIENVEKILESAQNSKDKKRAEAKLKRALVRLSVVNNRRIS